MSNVKKTVSNKTTVINQPHVFDVMPPAKTILTSLINKINEESDYKKYVITLRDSDQEKDRKKATAITDTISNIQIYNTKKKPLFLAKDIGVLLGMSHIMLLVKKLDPDESMTGHIMVNGKPKQTKFLTTAGLYRCFYMSTSPLSKLFRKFIGELLDHLVHEEFEMLNTFSNKFITENPVAVNAGLIDLQEKLDMLNKLNQIEQEKNKLMIEQLNAVKAEKASIEDDKNLAEIDISYQEMFIKQLKQDKELYITKYRRLNDEYSTLDGSSIDELIVMREAFMKPVQIYMVKPIYLRRFVKSIKPTVVKSGSKSVEPSALTITSKSKNKLSLPAELNLSDDELSDDEKQPLNSSNQTSLNNINWESEFTDYAATYESVYKTYVDIEEIVFLTTIYSKSISSASHLHHIGVAWVANKKHHVNLVEELAKTCENTKNTIHIFKTSIKEINDISFEIFPKKSASKSKSASASESKSKSKSKSKSASKSASESKSAISTTLVNI
jgi:prophage antirepressor-like protein